MNALTRCKYNADALCLPDCDREQCVFRGDDQYRFYDPKEIPVMRRGRRKAKKMRL